MTKYIIYFLVFVTVACSRYPSDVERALKFADDNRTELEQVLDHYAKGTKERLKYKAACFLIANMPYHTANAAPQMDAHSVPPTDEVKPDSLWNSVNPTGSKSQRKRHIFLVNGHYLQNEIDEAFAAWERAPWKDSITFDLFLHHIVPYCVGDESSFSYRKKLYDQYAPMIAGIDSPKRAFDVVYSYIIKNFSLSDITDVIDVDSSDTTDLMISNRSMKGTCDDRSRYIVSVARALCIPAAFDHITAWSNYSQVGHSWATYIGDGTKVFTMARNVNIASVRNDTVSHHNGVIDGVTIMSESPFDYRITGYKMDSVKTFAKIWRKTFEPHILKEIDYRNSINSIYFDIRSKDVSHLYNITSNNLRVALDRPLRQTLYLCTFLSAQGWVPVAAARPQRNSVKFKHVGKNIVYQVMYIDEDEFVPVGSPVIFYADCTQRVLNPDFSQTESVVLKRKYILPMRWLPRWEKAVGCRIEASDAADFNPSATTELLHEISELPIGITHINTNPTKAYRYARFMKPKPKIVDLANRNLQLAELSFYATTESGALQEVGGKTYGNPDMHAAFDKDYMTQYKVQIKKGRWVAIDFGNPQHITAVEYCLENDGNFIERGDHYELFYYDMDWKSLGSRIADTYYLNYDNVPKNALLWLRNHTKGKEERIFTYEDDKQIWW